MGTTEHCATLVLYSNFRQASIRSRREWARIDDFASLQVCSPQFSVVASSFDSSSSPCSELDGLKKLPYASGSSEKLGTEWRLLKTSPTASQGRMVWRAYAHCAQDR